jgi:hypothetical protein
MPIPLFEPEELARLDEAAVVTRDYGLIEIVADCEEKWYGVKYATARALGRALRALTVLHSEYLVPKKFENPVGLQRLDKMDEADREVVAGWLARHSAAREAEQTRARTYREQLVTQASERVGVAERLSPSQQQQREPIRPLVTEIEAVEIHSKRMTLHKQGRESWGQETMHTMVVLDRERMGSEKTQPLSKWERDQMFSHDRGQEYERGVVSEYRVLSLREAREIIRQHDKDRGLDRDTQKPHRTRS